MNAGMRFRDYLTSEGAAAVKNARTRKWLDRSGERVESDLIR
jgi:hypothetical protein